MSDANTKRILATLDKHLRSEIDLVVYGKSALHLIVEEEPRISLTNDIDLEFLSFKNKFLIKGLISGMHLRRLTKILKNLAFI